MGGRTKRETIKATRRGDEDAVPERTRDIQSQVWQCYKSQLWTCMFYRELMGKAHPMSFMYDPPPGYKQEEDKVCCILACSV